MGISSAMQWWEEWQLRVLLLASLVVQYVLLITSLLRKFPMKPGVRPILWLAYLGSDAIAIYALATLFNRHKNQDGSHGVLEVFWAPILLIHLGGRDSITAFNIEDNELWTRHLLVAVSQVTVAVYVFCKSWPGNDKRLLQAAIILFVIGVLKCLGKPMTLNRASINSLASSQHVVRRKIHAQRPKINPLQAFVVEAKIKNPDDGASTVQINSEEDFTPYNLFVDFASPSRADRIRTLRLFSSLDENYVYDWLQNWLSDAFHLFYTKENISSENEIREGSRYRGDEPRPNTSGVTVMTALSDLYSCFIRCAAGSLLFASIFLFYKSRREAYNNKDIKVTYSLLCCTFFMEAYSIVFAKLRLIRKAHTTEDRSQDENATSILDDKVSQYNLMGFFVRHKRHYILMRILGLLKCRDFIHQRWSMKSSSSSRRITKLVLQHVKGGWEDHIQDASSYREFNDTRGQLALRSEGCYDELAWTIDGPFDESVLLWHIATDFCYYRTGASAHRSQCGNTCQSSCHHKRAVQCRDMSNYMAYLLYVNPEMLMAGTRRRLFTAAYKGLNSIIGREGNDPPLEESKITEMIITAVEREGSHPNFSEEGIIHDAWAISKVLLEMPAEKTWKVIEGVWVEMLCFSAARCRGYLHAKALGMGTQYLTHVWLLLYQMGMESLADRLQRVEIPKEGADHSSSHVSRAAGEEEGEEEEGPGPSSSQDNYDKSTSQDNNASTGQEGGAGPSSSQGQDHCDQSILQDNNATGQDIV